MNSDTQRRQWSTPKELVAVGFVLSLAAGLCAVFTDDLPGKVLLYPISWVLMVFSIYAGKARPRLCADVNGVTVRGLTGTNSWPWAAVDVWVGKTRRFGRESSVLELDIRQGDDERLIVLGKLDLGSDPEDVAQELAALRLG